jgi:hypothetical protein
MFVVLRMTHFSSFPWRGESTVSGGSRQGG